MHVATNVVQATDFGLVDGTGTALIRVERGSDLAVVHAQLSDMHGLELHATTSLIVFGDRVRVHGVIDGRPGVSPHRRGEHDVVILAKEIEAID